MSESRILLTENEAKAAIENAVHSVLSDFLSNMKADEVEEVLNIKGASKVIKKAPKTIYKLVGEGKIPHMKQGHHLIFFRTQLIEWLKSYRVKTIAELANEAENKLLLSTRRKE